jgi:uncharacterized repeat protein (TIGR03803 family)
MLSLTLALFSFVPIHGGLIGGPVDRAVPAPVRGGPAARSVYRPSGTFTTLYAFKGAPDGQVPQSGVVMDSNGNIYGNTAAGGANGAGTIFKLTPSGSGYSEQVILSYTLAVDGDQPFGSVALDKHGDVFGTAPYGGPPNNGTAVELKPIAGGKYRETAVHAFAGTDGYSPLGMIRDGSTFYAAVRGGANYNSGAIDAILPPDLGTSVVFPFGKASGGGTQFPSWDLVAAPGGKYYGTASYPDSGAVYSFDPKTGAVSTLFVFVGTSGGQSPTGAIASKKGTVYGTTMYGGAAGIGVIYKLTQSGTSYKETVLHSFTGASGDGSYPEGTLLLEGKTLYGTTLDGGNGCGTIFSIDTSGKHYNVVYALNCVADEEGPGGDLLWSNGAIYGVVTGDGVNSGTVYRFVP